MTTPNQVLTRHNEIRKALRFFLHSWYKHKQHGSYPDPRQVMVDFALYKSLTPVINRLSPPSPHVDREPPKPKFTGGGSGAARGRDGGSKQ